MKKTRIIYLTAFAIIAGIFIIGCGSTEDRLAGTWVTESVTAKVDSSKANLPSIDQSIASTKTTTFILNEDHSMALTIDGYTTDAFWTFNADDNMLSFHMEKDFLTDAINLGKYKDGKIVYTSSVKHGTITAVYVKE
ncbi:MAG: hypothetical protein V2I47_07825 [Bacteroidales bacterium]|jgi:hypothetical protein|nr:hypothetical protein [Bacteroidales bacterium]